MDDLRATELSAGRENRRARYVLYWMQMFKRAAHNHALDFAIRAANKRGLPVVVYEGLKYYYPWANDRLHTFILEGVAQLCRMDKEPVQVVRYVSDTDNVRYGLTVTIVSGHSSRHKPCMKSSTVEDCTNHEISTE